MFLAALFCCPLVAWCEPRLGAAVVHSNLNVVTEVGDVPTVTCTHVAPRAQMGDKHEEKYGWAYKCVPGAEACEEWRVEAIGNGGKTDAEGWSIADTLLRQDMGAQDAAGNVLVPFTLGARYV